MADSADNTTKRDNTPMLGAIALTTIADTSVIDPGAQTKTTKGKTIWEKSPEEVADEVETLIKSHEDNCPERKRRHDEFYNQWDEDMKSLDKKQNCLTHFVAPEIIVSLQKAREQFAQLKELHGKIGKSMEKFASSSTE